MTNREVENKKKIEKATALLSLAATDENAQGPCLTPQEMAELIENRCGKYELAAFQLHLGSCDKCYSEWLFLKKSQKPVKKRGQIYRLSWSKKMGFVGSALAAAASVAIYLNIPNYHDNYLKDSVPTQEMLPGKSESYEPKPHLQLKKGEEIPATLSIPVAADSMEEEHQQIEEKLESDMASPEERAKQPSMRTASPAQVKKKTRAPEIMAAFAERDESTEDIDHWFSELQKACLSGQHDHSFWLLVRQKGESIIETQSPTLTQEKRAKLTTVLQLLNQINDEESAVAQCRQMISELAEDDKSR
jgi:hypothetical protein